MENIKTILELTNRLSSVIESRGALLETVDAVRKGTLTDVHQLRVSFSADGYAIPLPMSKEKLANLLIALMNGEIETLRKSISDALYPTQSIER